MALPLRLFRAFATIALPLALSGCERVAVPPAPQQLRKEVLLEEVTLPAAAITRIKLADLGMTASALDARATADGAVIAAGVYADELRLSTPGDVGHDQQGTVTIAQGTTTRRIPVSVRTLKPDASAIPPDERIDGQDIPDLTVTGLGEGNTLEQRDLAFSLERVGPLDPKESRANLYVPATRQVISLANWWFLRRSDNALVVRKERLRQLLKGVPQGEYQMSVALVTANEDFGMGYTFFVQRADASLRGRFLTRKGEAMRALAGRPLILRGINNRVREVIELDEDGRFEVDALVPGLYHLELVDLANPGAVTLQVPVHASSRSLEAAFVLDPPHLFRHGQPPISYVIEKGQKPPIAFPLPEIDGPVKRYVESPFRKIRSIFPATTQKKAKP